MSPASSIVVEPDRSEIFNLRPKKQHRDKYCLELQREMDEIEALRDEEARNQAELVEPLASDNGDRMVRHFDLDAELEKMAANRDEGRIERRMNVGMIPAHCCICSKRLGESIVLHCYHEYCQSCYEKQQKVLFKAWKPSRCGKCYTNFARVNKTPKTEELMTALQEVFDEQRREAALAPVEEAVQVQEADEE
jgi:hypothetical protein